MFVVISLVFFCLSSSDGWAETDEYVPKLLKPGNDVSTVHESPKPFEPPRISSVFGVHTLKEYILPFEDQYPTGPFERLDKRQFLFISKCGDVYFARLNDKLELIKPGKPLTKFIPGGESSDDESNSKQVVYCKELSGVKFPASG